MNRRLLAILAAYVAAAGALVFLYRDAYSQDGGLHYLLARWAWQRPITFVEVWARPGFTLLYSFPAQLGYLPAKLFTVLVTALAAWQTAATARALKLARPWMAAPLLLASPVLFLLSTETMTEPLFALAFATALRLHFEDRVRASLVVASLLPLLRPEGFFLCAAWALFDRRPRLLLLGVGTAVWVVAAWILSGDPLYLWNHWPWSTGRRQAPSALALLRYPLMLPLIAGPFLVPFAVLGAISSWRERWRLPLVLVGTSLALFTALSVLGLFDAGGRSRLIAPVAPALALFALRGWRGKLEIPIFVLSFAFAFGAVDLSPTNRDWKAFRSTIGRMPPSTRLVASQMYAYAEMDRPPGELPFVRGDRAGNLAKIAALPEGTLVLWDDHFGPWYFALDASDFSGFRLLEVTTYDLPPLAPWPGFLEDWVGRRKTTIWAMRK